MGVVIKLGLKCTFCLEAVRTALRAVNFLSELFKNKQTIFGLNSTLSEC